MFNTAPTDLGVRWDRRSVPWGRGLDALAVTTLVALGLALGLLFAFRRLQGALQQPLSTGSLLAVGVTLVMLALGVRHYTLTQVTSRSAHGGPLWYRTVGFWALWLAPTVITSSMTLALTIPGTSWLALVLLWLLAGSQELVAAINLSTAIRSSPGRLAESVRGELSGSACPISTTSARDLVPSTAGFEGENMLRSGLVDEADDVSTDEELEIPRGVVQQITRFRTEEGDDVLTAALRAQLASGERQQSLHVAFCPPFVTIPEFSLQQIGGPSATLKAAQILHHGARIDVRRQGDCTESADVLVEMTACCGGSDQPLSANADPENR